MRGFIDKGEGGLFVAYVALSNPDDGSVIRELPLHPDDIKELSADDLARIFANRVVDFTIVEECFNYDGKHFGKDCSCREGFVQYAKINTYGF